MSATPIFPLKYEIVSGVKAGPVLFSGNGWQIIRSTGLSKNVLIANNDLSYKWLANGLLDKSHTEDVKFGIEQYTLILNDERILTPVFACPEPKDKFEAIGFATALRRTRELDKESQISGGIYCEKYAIILPVPFAEEVLTDDVLLGYYLTGGVALSCFSERRLLSLMHWITKDELHEICFAANVKHSENKKTDTDVTSKEVKDFRLVGRPQLEAFIQDNIIDIIINSDRYKKLGIEFPAAMVLHGPPGCGKTFAVEALVEYLDLPSFTISSGSVGSPYIHETGRKISGIFETAIKQAPSIVIIDEMEAFLSDREFGGGQSHRVEEVAEFLRIIPDALKKKVLVIGMTNRIDIIDSAILRRGRFDHVIKVDMPTAEEVETLLNDLFSERPCHENIELKNAIELLTGRPLSDASFLVREAARLSAKAGKSEIDAESLEEALHLVVREKADATKRKKIGFGRD